MKIIGITNYNFTGSTRKTGSQRVKSEVITDSDNQRKVNGFFIDKDGYLTKAQAHAQSEKYMVLAEDEKSFIFKPSIKSNKSKKPALAKVVLQKEIQKVREENKIVEDEIAYLNNEIEENLANTNKKVKNIEEQNQKLVTYYSELGEVTPKICSMSDRELLSVCAKYPISAFIYKNENRFDSHFNFNKDAVSKFVCRNAVPTKIDNSLLEEVK